MGPHSEIGEKLKATLEPSAHKANGSVDKKLENELVYTANYEGNKLGKQFIEQSEKVHITSNVEVDIMECTNSGGNKLVEAECLDTTESSSSFDDSDCGVVGTFDDSEALSGFHGDNGATLDFYGFDELFRPTYLFFSRSYFIYSFFLYVIAHPSKIEYLLSTEKNIVWWNAIDDPINQSNLSLFSNVVHVWHMDA